MSIDEVGNLFGGFPAMRFILILSSLFFAAFTAYSAEHLLFLEVQGVAGYSDMEGEGVIYRSNHAKDAMQKNSVGLDFLQKLSGESAEIGSLAVQLRAAYDEDENKGELQLYNAYLKFKTPAGDLWGGHNRAALGLASYLDTHGELFQTLPMYGFGYDRDWGVGYQKDFAEGDLRASLTTATGMPLEAGGGNYLAAARYSYGVLNYDNFNIGLSGAYGKVMNTIGYEFLDDDIHKSYTGALDAAYNHDRFEHRFELQYGGRDEKRAAAVFYKHTVNFLEENRLKLNLQFVYTSLDKVYNYYYLAGGAFNITGDLSLRLMYQRWDETDKSNPHHGTMRMRENRYIAQVYFYKNI